MGKRITILLLIFAGLFWWASQAEKNNQEINTSNEPVSEKTLETEESELISSKDNINVSNEDFAEDVSVKENNTSEKLDDLSVEDEKVSFWEKVKGFFTSEKSEETGTENTEDEIESDTESTKEEPSTEQTEADHKFQEKNADTTENATGTSEENIAANEKTEEVNENTVESTETKSSESSKNNEENKEEVILETQKDENVKTIVPVIKSVTTNKTMAKNVGIKTVKNVTAPTPKTDVITEEKEEVIEEPVVVTPPKPVLPNNVSNVRVYIYENGIDFSEKDIPAGIVNFEVINTGRFSHEFIIAGIQNFGKIPPRSVAEISVGIFPGTYEVYSDYRQDYERGVRDVITIK